MLYSVRGIFTESVVCCHTQVGDIVVGQVVQYEQSGALVDIGGKSSAFLSPPEASMQRVDDLEDYMMIGDHREFQVMARGRPCFPLLLSSSSFPPLFHFSTSSPVTGASAGAVHGWRACARAAPPLLFATHLFATPLLFATHLFRCGRKGRATARED